jgi:hypothetical protein
MGAMHGISCLESNHLPPGQLLEVCSEFGRRVSKGDVVKVVGWLNGLHLPANVVILDPSVQVGNCRVRRVIRPEDLNSLFYAVRSIYIFYSYNGKCFVISWIPQCKSSSWCYRETLDVIIGNVESDGHGE